MAVKAASSSHSLELALAVVCFALISISVALEHSIHFIDRWLKRHHKKALNDALDKLKIELMLVGFISLLLSGTQRTISSICIPDKVAYTMLPCHSTLKTTAKLGGFENSNNDKLRKLLSTDQQLEGSSDSAVKGHCESKGMVSLISQDGLHQLRVFIFLLALVHVVFSVFTMALGRLKMRHWKGWEKETQTTEYLLSNGNSVTISMPTPPYIFLVRLLSNDPPCVSLPHLLFLYNIFCLDPNRFRYTRQTTFGRRHMNLWADTSLHLWIKCFFRQFFHSVAKIDYFTLRHGFIATHNSTNTFNFRKYIQRSLEDDFKVVVGISSFMWFIMVLCMLFDVHGWNVYLWLSFVPLVIVLALGTKLEVIVTRMALRVKGQSSVIQGVPLVQPNDELFWFGRPKFLLHFLHITLFLNAFEVAFFIWITYEFGLRSCYHENAEMIITRVVLAIIVQVICSYITLPLYALITQMGSQYKRSILEEQTANALKKWHQGVRKNRKKQPRKHQHQESTPSPSISAHNDEGSNNNSSTYMQVSSPHLGRSPTLAGFVPAPTETSNQEIFQEVAEHPVMSHSTN